MLRTLLVAAVIACAYPSIADACLNEVQLTTDDYARIVAKAERQLESGQYRAAKRTLGRGHMPTAPLQRRADDVRAVLQLRTTKNAKQLAAAADHFRARSEAKDGKDAKDVRYRAWLGEALVALGKLDEAKPILADLHARDLMPDAYAYVALAKLSSGTERYELWKACRTRAKNKSICELPAHVATTASAPRS